MSDNAARYEAMLEFLGTFPTVSGSAPNEMKDLSDGVVLFEVLSEISPDYFDPSTIARHLGDNWALKSSNLRKLMRNMEWFYHEELKKEANFPEMNSQLGSIARDGNEDSIAALVELVAAAAVTCPKKGEFVSRIMGMTQQSQIQMKGIIESSLARLDDYDGDDDEGHDAEMVFDDNIETQETKDLEKDLFDPNSTKDPDAEKEELERQIQELRRELSQYKSQTTDLKEDGDKAQAKLRALVEDLQDRLARRQDELITAEEELRDARNDLDDAKSRLSTLEEERAQLADELDVASAKASQLHKAEATVIAYKKKLEGVGVINQQMTDLEDQAAGYLRQIMDLESEVKKTKTLQKEVDDLQKKLMESEKERTTNTDALKSTTAEMLDVKSKLQASESAKKMFEEEIKELRAKQSVEVDIVSDGVEGLSIDGSQNLGAMREKAMRMEIENKKLQEELAALKNGGAVASVGTAAVSAAATAAMQKEIDDLKAELEKKEAHNKKIASDKDKLEAYTKRTLAKFQDKYLVALQECKAKLKEKQDKIEVLESRSATEKTAQKREERLLSSTIYELGLAIMQHRLKER